MLHRPVEVAGDTGRSATNFQKPKFERLLLPKAVVQTTSKTLLRTSANGQERPFEVRSSWIGEWGVVDLVAAH